MGVSYERGTPVAMTTIMAPPMLRRAPHPQGRLTKLLILFPNRSHVSARRNPTTCGANQGDRKRQFDPTLRAGVASQARKIDIRLPGKGNSNSHGARPAYLNDFDDSVNSDQ